MRKIIVDNQEVIIDDEDDRRKPKYQDAKKVGKNKEELKKIIDEYNANIEK